jgi:hypothetical protein
MKKVLCIATMLMAFAFSSVAMASQFGLSGGLIGQTVNDANITAFTIGPIVYTDNWLLDLGMSFQLSSEAITASGPMYGGFGMGYMFGHDATAIRPFIMVGVNAEFKDGDINSGPKIFAGLSKPIEDATLLVLGPELFYTLDTEDYGYRIKAELVFKLGASTSAPTNAGAGGETPSGLFPAN